MEIFQTFCLLEVWCKLPWRVFFLWINEEEEEGDVNKIDFRDPLQCVKSCFIFWRKLLLQMQNEHFTITFFLNIAVSTKIWQSRCRTGPQPVWHRELRSFASNECRFLLLWWGSRQGCAHPHCLPHSESVCPVLAFRTSLSVPDLPFPNAAEGKAPLSSSSPARSTILLCCTLLWKPRAVTSAQQDIWIWPPTPGFQQIICTVLLFVSSSHVYIVPRSF